MQRESTFLTQGFYETADILIAGVVILGILTVTNLESMPQGIETFLKARITIGNAILCTVFLLIWHIMFTLAGVYLETRRSNPRQETRRLLAASSVASSFVIMFPASSQSQAFTWPSVFYFWTLTTAATIMLRIVVRTCMKYAVVKPQQIIIVGSGPRALSMYQEMQEMPEQNYRVLGFVDSPNGHKVPDEVQCRMLGPIEDLDRILMRRVVDQVVIALPIKSCYDDIQRTIAVCEQSGVESEYISDAFNLSLAHAQHGTLETRSVVRFKVVEDDHRLVIKRVIDIVAAMIGLVCCAPMLLLIAMAIKLTSRGPVCFNHERYGLGKRRFVMYKFRTMVANAEELKQSIEHLNEAQGPVFKIRRDPRITPLGRFLRKTSLDELPQLFNVLRGDMSLVGPRPLINRDVALFQEPWLMRRFSVKPGITCLWQISGRSNLNFDRWIELDLQYIDSWSLGQDFSILMRTLPAVLRGQGAA